MKTNYNMKDRMGKIFPSTIEKYRKFGNDDHLSIEWRGTRSETEKMEMTCIHSHMVELDKFSGIF